MNNALIERIKACPTLPSLPAIAVQVLELAQQTDADISEIARIISKDPALTSKLLRTVNSSFYGRSQNVGTISQALVILGLQSVKTLVLGFSLVGNLSKTKANGFQHVVFWKRSIFSATAARMLAAKAGIVQQEEAFLAALLMDIGMLVLDMVEPMRYTEVYGQAKTHQDLAALELSAFQLNHASVAGILAQHWKLPPMLYVPVSAHHDASLATDPQIKRLADVVRIAGRCADVFIEADAGPAIADVRELTKALGVADPDGLLAEIGLHTKEVAKLFEINIGSTQQFDAILKKANEALVELTLQSQMQNTQLQQQNLKLQEQATKDGLTGLANRAAFDQTLVSHLADSRATGKPLALLILDVDKFKNVNDTHGHPAGDAVLRMVAKLFGSAARPQDLAARFGGEEMALLLPNTPCRVAALIAETVRNALASTPVKFSAKIISITASIGLATFEAGSPLREPAHLLKAADLALYNAKHSGRNCVKIFTLPTKKAA